MSDADAGKRFKKFIECLAANKAPKDSIEESMINEAKAYSEWKRQVAFKRWNKEPEKQQQPRGNRPKAPPEFTPPPSATMEKLRKDR